MIKEREQKKSEETLIKERIANEALKKATPEVLLAIMFGTQALPGMAALELQKRIEAGKVEKVDVRKWIYSLGFFNAASVERQAKNFYDALEAGGFDFSIADLEILLLAFKGARELSDTASNLLDRFLSHTEKTETQVLKVIDAFSNNRKTVFEICRKNFNISFTGYARCLVYQHAGTVAMGMIEQMDVESLEFDRATVKQFLMEATSHIHVADKVFKLLSNLKMFTEEDLLLLNNTIGLKKYVARARIDQPELAR